MLSSENHQLQRKLGLLALLSMVVANMIGAGIFTTSGLIMAQLRNPFLLLLLWAFGGFIAFCGALVYSELGAAMPEAGGEYVFLSRLYHPLLGFLSGWISFVVGFSAPIAASAIGFSEYIIQGVPSDWVMEYHLSNLFAIRVLAVLVIALFTVIHVRGIETSARWQNILTVLKVVLITGLIISGFIWGKGSWEHFVSEAYTIKGPGWRSIGLSLIWVMFAYSGWNAATYLGGEAVCPQKNIPRSLLFGTLVVISLYLALNFLFIYAIPPEKFQGEITVGATAVVHLFGENAKYILSFLIAFALLSSISAFIVLGPRVYYAMAKDGFFFRFAAKVSSRYRIPVRSIILQSSVSALMVMTGTFDQILTFMGFALGIFPIIAVLGVFRLRKLKRTTYRHPGYPYVPVIYVVTAVTMLVLTAIERPAESLIAIAVILVGIPAFLLFKNSNA
ncbi:amino acid permease [Prolixibacter bellariivorans]|uniref:Amino acid permease n=1 Tax=Prolixibacter bellariivorans TaxID=314319 RepID=A0A5M4B4V9_9BACT|nr:amino acid permease [Prolixibacter bellariivorans]GET34878.1 amino acid permease [Prolixibacter bellariivorans]